MNADWTSPVNYADGTLHIYFHIRGIPRTQRMRVCFNPYQSDPNMRDNIHLEYDKEWLWWFEEGTMHSAEGRSGALYKWSVPMNSMWVKTREGTAYPIDWSTEVNATGYVLYENDVAVQNSTATTYTARINTTVTETGIARSVGWHLFQIQAFPAGVYMKIDGKTFSGNTYPTMVKGSTLTILTNFGSSTDPNQIWVDSVGWSNSPELDRTLSTQNETVILDYGFEADASHWQMSAGTSNTLTLIDDDGCQSVAGCLDSHNAVGGAYGFEGLLTAVVPISAYYKLGFYYMNGPHDFDGVDNLTVTLDDTATINLGSGNLATDAWIYSYGETDEMLLDAGDDASIKISGTCQSTNTLTRFDHFVLGRVPNSA